MLYRDDHRRHCCRLHKQKVGSPNNARRARSDSCIRKCGQSTTAPLCLQHQHTGNNPSLALQLYAEQTSHSSFSQLESKSRKVITGVVQGGVLSPALFNYYLADFPTPPPSIKQNKYANDITICSSGPVVADIISGLNIYLSQVLNYINSHKLTVATTKSTLTLSSQILMSTTYIHKLSWPTKYHRSKRSQKC